MRTSADIHKTKRTREFQQGKGNWMHLTIAPLVEEMLDDELPLPGTAGKDRELRSVVGTAGRTGFADDDSTEAGE